MYIEEGLNNFTWYCKLYLTLVYKINGKMPILKLLICLLAFIDIISFRVLKLSRENPCQSK